MNILKLTIEKKWFDRIKSGEKLEEYLEIKPHWISRLVFGLVNERVGIHPCYGKISAEDYARLVAKDFDAIHFYNGAYFSDKLPNFVIEAKGISIGKGRTDWGAPREKDVFIIKLGKIIK